MMNDKQTLLCLQEQTRNAEKKSQSKLEEDVIKNEALTYKNYHV